VTAEEKKYRDRVDHFAEIILQTAPNGDKFVVMAARAVTYVNEIDKAIEKHLNGIEV